MFITDRDLEINELQQALLKSRENNTQLLNKMTLLKVGALL